MTTTTHRADCRYCERYGRACGRDHSEATRGDWNRDWQGNPRGAKVFYLARFAAEGGPGFTGPKLDAARHLGEDSGAVAVVYVEGTAEWAIMDAQGNAYAAAKDPAELGPWMATYLASLGRMHARGEL